MYLSREAFAGESSGVQTGRALFHHTVDGHFFPGLYHNDCADLHFIRVHLLQLAVLFQVGGVRANVHQFADVPAAFAHSVALEPFSNLIEQHDCNGFRVVAALFVESQNQGSYGGNSHEKTLVKDLAVPNAFHGLEQNVIADDPIIHQIGCQPDTIPQARQHLVQGGKRRASQQLQHQKQRCGGKNPHQHFVLLFRQAAP